MKKKHERIWGIKIGDHTGKYAHLNYFFDGKLFYRKKDAIALKKELGNKKYMKVVEFTEI